MVSKTCSIYLIKACQRLEVVVLAEVQHQREQAEDLSVEAELQEEPVVVFSNAVIDPGGEGMATLKTHAWLQKEMCKKHLPLSSIRCLYTRFAAYSPGTVMVHFANAVAAAAAVVGAFGAHEVALVAQLPVLPLCQGRTTTVGPDAYSSRGDLYMA